MTDEVGISGFAVYVPPYRVDLESWCRWTNNVWDKTRAVVGHSFRMRGPAQSVYTMAATAVMRLIDQYDIDPNRVGFLGLGTESSTDNSAGAVIVKGMLDEGLQASGRPPLSRHCEVPEVKHACLGGVYALKHALRYLALETEDRCAIVVSADIAEYARGSSGEPTQGAGAVAMLVERNPHAAQGPPRAHRQRVVVSRRRLPQAGDAQHHPRQAELPLPRLAGVQRQVLDDLLPRRDAARVERHGAAHGPRSVGLLPRARGDLHAPALSPHAGAVVRDELLVRAWRKTAPAAAPSSRSTASARRCRSRACSRRCARSRTS